jgi:Pyridine nucleotide-disulphide oxidoreductase
VPHYVDTRDAASYAGKRLFIVGKQNSGFELATGLLQWAQQIVLASPRPAKLSVNTHSLVGVRARYLQPWEDSVLGGGVFILDASLDRVEHLPDGYRLHLLRTDTGAPLQLAADEVIAATGFVCPLRDLPALGVATFGQSRLPAQTPFWQSASLPGIYFAGTITQGSAGLKKYGIPANSGAVHGARYNARVLARHIARTRFGWQPDTPSVAPERAVEYLLEEVTNGPEFWHQRSYLARQLTVAGDGGYRDDGIVPLAHFVDEAGPDAAAITVETDDTGDIHPCLYVRRKGAVQEQVLATSPLLDFRASDNARLLQGMLSGLVSG